MLHLQRTKKFLKAFMIMQCFSLHNVNNVKIIGWSAGDVDIPYLLRIKDSVNKDARWTVYYYNPDAYNSLQKALSKCGVLDDFVVDFQESNNFWDT